MKSINWLLAIMLLLSVFASPAAAEEDTPEEEAPAVSPEPSAVEEEAPAASPEAGTAENAADRFTDLKDLPAEVKEKFGTLIEAGVFKGISDGLFGLDLNMTRAQFAKVAALIFALPVDDKLAISSFSDVKADDKANGYALPYIEALKIAELTNGYGSDTTRYNPSGKVSRQELAAFLIRGLGMEAEAREADPSDDATVSPWARTYATFALEKNLLPASESGTFEGTSPVTRYELALAAYEARNIFLAGIQEAGKVSILEAKASGARKVAVKLSQGVDTEKAKLTASAGGDEVSGETEWAEDNMSATITLDEKLAHGKYQVKLSDLDEGTVDRAEAEFDAEDERLETLAFAAPSDILPRSKAIIDFKAANQYGETSDWTAGDFEIKATGADVNAVQLPGKQAFQLDVSRLPKGAGISIILFRKPLTDTSLKPVTKVFTVGDLPVVSKVEAGDLKFFGADTALKPGGRAYLLFAAYDQYGFRVTDPELLGGERGIDTVFSEPGIFNDKPSLDKFFDYDDDGYVDLSLEVSPDVKVDKQVNLMLLSRIYGEPASVTLKVVLSKIPASVEFDYSDTLTIGDEDEYIPIIVKDAEGKELSPEDIVNAETTGRLQVTGSNQLVLESDPPTRTDYSVTPNAVRQTAVQATGSDRGKIRIARVMNYGPAFISILLPYSSKMETFNLNIEQARERTPASVELDGDSNNLLFPGTEHQIKFKILDQYGDQLNTTLPDYKVDYKLERVSGESGAITTKGAAVLTDAAPAIRREINDSSGKGVTFVADTLKMGTYRLKASLVRVDAGGAVIGTLAAASSVAEVFGGSQALTYEMDLDDALFAAGRYYYEHGVIRSVTDATYLLENKDVFAREIEISAKDELGREVTLPSNIVRSIGSANPDMIGDDDVNRIIGLNAGKSTVTVIFDSPTGARTLSKEVEVKYERPAIQEVKVDKSANVVDSAQLNGLLPWDANLMKKITVKDQFGDSFDNDKLARYNDIFGIVYLIGDIHFRPNTAPAMKDVLYIDGGGRIVYQPGSGNPIDNNVEDFTLTAITPDGKTYSTFISVQ